ncbi:DUF1593 domain-containing protein [Sphingobium sp. BYY-5]|uniref:DUF1593 domain-containing protein n=1 Tax=Sphingobium sp. BYY-5 TaxID=2926400 RepID=UPI001FA7EE28|nr:DUF1593 domain-containing protein [Sphingobium sp. BYY-5]MCI4592482.1 DUF1593 domain-containing protein [Sphingobium sp. BYY-5]
MKIIVAWAAIASATLPAALLAASPTTPSIASPMAKQRLIVLSDIEADPDDSQSFIRLFLYANQIDIEGLVATTSTHMKTAIHPDSIRRIIEAYGKVQPNLMLHEQGYPAASKLASLVRDGQLGYGMAMVGNGHDTAGSRLIVEAMARDDPRPLWVSIWGGANTLAQALHGLKASRSPEEVKRLVARLRIYTISDQDDSGAWIRKTFPDLFYIVSPGGYGAGTWTGIHARIDGADNDVISNDWLRDHIQQDHGPLGAAYPDVAYGIEGDTPAYLSLIPNGLSNAERPDWGGWGGRYELYTPSPQMTDPSGFTGGVPIEVETRPIWTNATDNFTPLVDRDVGRARVPGDRSYKDFRATLWRWRTEFQNDFAARMDWSVKGYEDANHPPVARLASPARMTVKGGQRFVLSAAGSTDPDGDNLSYYWSHYPEVGGWSSAIASGISPNIHTVDFTAPKVDAPRDAHFIVAVTDKGSPPLTRYARVVVTIEP